MDSKRIFILMNLVVFMLGCLFVNPAAANEHDVDNNSKDPVSTESHVEPVDTPKPIKGIAPSKGRPIGEEAFEGPTEVTHETSGCSGQDVCPDHFSIVAHTHKIDAITGRYDGHYGDQPLGAAVIGPATLILHETMSWSHTFGVSIGFEKGVINGAVGYDVSYSTSQEYEYQFPVNAGERKQIHKKDWYHVTNMNVSTHYISCTTYNCSQWTESGTAWAGQFFLREIWAKHV